MYPGGLRELGASLGLPCQRSEKLRTGLVSRPCSIKGSGSLLFQHDLGFLGVEFLTAIGASYVPERYWLGNRTKLPQRPLSLRIAVRVCSSDQRMLGRHRLLLGMLGMIGNAHDRLLVGYHNCRLPENSSGRENDEND